MNVSFYFKDTDKTSQDLLRRYLTDKKIGRLTRLLKHGNLEVADFKIRVDHSSHHNKFSSVNLTLNIGKKKFVAEERGLHLPEIFDLAFDCLVFQVRKMEAVRHDT